MRVLPISDIEAIVIDKGLKDLLPKLTDKEYGDLEEAILQEGCREPLVLWDDQGQKILLGGHNRFAICKQHGINFQAVLANNVTNLYEAKMWMLRDQLGKRNLTDFARARFALQFEDLVGERAKKNRLSGLKQNLKAIPQNSAERVDTREVLAELAGVSHDTIARTKFITRKGAKEQIDKLEKGEISINSVYTGLKEKQERKKLPKAEDFVKRLKWAVNRDVIPIGTKLIDIFDELNGEQKKEVTNVLEELRKLLNKMSGNFNSEGIGQ